MTDASHNYYTDADPLERNEIRLRGLRAICLMADSAMRDTTARPADHVYLDLFLALELLSEDIARDMHAIRRQSREARP